MNTNTESNRIFGHFILGAVLFLTGCPGEAGVCSGGETTCPSESYPFGCWNFWGVKMASCQENLTAAHAWCALKGGGSLAAFEIDCQSADDEVGDSGWGDPSEYVTNPSAGVYNVDYALVGQIKNDFTILGNDSTVLVESALTDYFELSGVSSGDLADLLGLQTGDILLSVNSYSLNGFDDAMTAYSAVENDSTLVLAFKRSGTVYYHTYYVIYTY